MRRLERIPWGALAELIPAQLHSPIDKILTGSRAERVLDAFLRQHRGLSADGRRAVAEALFGVGLWRRRLEWQGSGVAPAALLMALLRDLARISEPDAIRLSGFDSRPPPVRSPPEDPAWLHSFPDWIVSHLTARTKTVDELHAVLDAFNLPGPVCFRVNALRTTMAQATAALEAQGVHVQPGTFARTALIPTQRPSNIYGLTPIQNGELEVQDEGSQLVGLLVGAQPGDTVLDLCAGAGGKTLLLASEMKNQGTLYAYDTDRARLGRLRHRAERAGVNHLRILETLPDSLQVDRVLIDAPCSEIGALRRGPDLRWHIPPDSPEQHAALQTQLLNRAVKHVRPGGTLVYATCSLTQEENEHVTRAFEAGHLDFERSPLPKWLGATLASETGLFVCLPHLHGTDGFYATVHRRSE